MLYAVKQRILADLKKNPVITMYPGTFKKIAPYKLTFQCDVLPELETCVKRKILIWNKLRCMDEKGDFVELHIEQGNSEDWSLYEIGFTSRDHSECYGPKRKEEKELLPYNTWSRYKCSYLFTC